MGLWRYHWGPVDERVAGRLAKINNAQPITTGHCSVKIKKVGDVPRQPDLAIRLALSRHRQPHW
jgi:hypothetical protein